MVVKLKFFLLNCIVCIMLDYNVGWVYEIKILNIEILVRLISYI